MTPVGRAALGALALVLGLGALAVGDPASGGPVGMGRAVLDPVEADPVMELPPGARIAPMELARRIRNRDRRLVVVDLRSAEEFEGFHIPTARRGVLPLEAPATGPDEVEAALRELVSGPDPVLVLYGDDPAPVLAARERLMEAGVDDVRVLEGGVAGWLDRVMNPVLADDAAPEERKAFLDAAEVSRYFGGVPRIVPREELERDPESVAEIVEDMRLRGCRGG